MSIILLIGGIQLFVLGYNGSIPDVEERPKIIAHELGKKYGDKFEVLSCEQVNLGSYKVAKHANIGEAKCLSDGIKFNYQVDLRCRKDLCDNYIGLLNEPVIMEDIKELLNENNLEEYFYNLELDMNYSYEAKTLAEYKEDENIVVKVDTEVYDSEDAENYYRLFHLLKDNGYVFDAKLRDSDNKTYLSGRPSDTDKEAYITEERFRNKMEDIGIY